jgi:polyketide biosynthesis acyl carrier protein
MERSEILAVVIKHMRRNIADLGDAPVDPSKSMLEYGAESLDIVEIVSSSMRELGIRMPRTELAGLQNIDQLVDKFAEAKQGTA